MPPDPRPWPTRAVARSTRAMVASPHALASAAGVDVLRRGGNAVDAAIAANAVLTVIYPASCGIGGDAFWMVHDPRTRSTVSYNGSGRTPRAASLDRLPNATLPLRGALSVTVPGAVRSWEDVAHAHGRRGLDELLEPAERNAREGFAVTDVVSAYCASNETMLRADPEAGRVFWAAAFRSRATCCAIPTSRTRWRRSAATAPARSTRARSRNASSAP